MDVATINAALEQLGYEMTGGPDVRPDGNMDVQANKLQQVAPVKGEELYVPIPVTLVIKIVGKEVSIVTGEPDDEQQHSAEKFVEMLVANGQVAGLAAQTRGRTSHQVRENEDGKKVIRRAGFSAH